MISPNLPEKLVPAINYVVQGNENKFAFKFVVVDAVDMYVYVNGVELSKGAYVVTGVDNDEGGEVTINAALSQPKKGDVVTLSRFTLPEQLTEFLRLGDFTAEAVNAEFVRIYQLLQEFRRDINSEGLKVDELEKEIIKNKNDIEQLGNQQAGAIKGVKEWKVGEEVTDRFQRYFYPNPSQGEFSYTWNAPRASVDTPVIMGNSPIGDDNWQVWDVGQDDVIKDRKDIREMLENPIKAAIGKIVLTGGVAWRRTGGDGTKIEDYEARSPIYAKDMGILTDGTEQTAEILSAIKLATTMGMKFIFNGDSEYTINPIKYNKDSTGATVHVHGLILEGGERVYFETGAVLKSISTSAERYCMILLSGEDIEVHNPKIIGDRDIHVGTSGEWGYGIRYDFNSKNCRVYNPNVTKCWGDSYVVVSNFGGNVLWKPYGAHSRRQGLSIIRTGPGGLNVHDYHFEFISGTLPEAGIDFEPDNSTEQLIVTLSGGGRCNDNDGYDLDFFFAKQSSASKAHEISFTGVHQIQQWIRFNSIANINVKNSIKFDTLKIGVNPSIGYIVHEASNGCDSINIDTLICDRAPLVNLLPRSEAEVRNFGRINVNKLIVNDESQFMRGIALSNPGELPKYKWTRADLIRVGDVVSSDSFNLQAISLPDATRLPVRYENVKCFTEIAGTTFTLELKNYQAKDIILTRTANTSFNVPVDAFSLGTTKTITGKKEGYTTRLNPVGSKINAKAEAVTFVHPFKIELMVDESSDNIGDSYIYKLIYGEVQP